MGNRKPAPEPDFRELIKATVAAIREQMGERFADRGAEIAGLFAERQELRRAALRGSRTGSDKPKLIASVIPGSEKLHFLLWLGRRALCLNAGFYGPCPVKDPQPVVMRHG